jgi:hypothetical protein
MLGNTDPGPHAVPRASTTLGARARGHVGDTIEPSPVDETSNDGRLSLDLGRIDAGRTFVLYMQFQTNPTNVGHR